MTITYADIPKPISAGLIVLDPLRGTPLRVIQMQFTRLATKTIPNTHGEISAPKGTHVQLKTRTDREVAQALLVTGATSLPLEVRQGRDLAGTLLVSQAGSYRFRFLDARGHLLVEGPPIPIVVEEDAPPKVSLVLPVAEVEVDPAAASGVATAPSDRPAA